MMRDPVNGAFIGATEEVDRMTTEEALIQPKVEKLNSEEGTITITATNEWLETVANALEKQIPKKPDRTSRPYKCPACGSWEGIRSLGFYLPPYCCMCGQKLDWSYSND